MQILQVASCYRNWDKLLPYGPLGLYADFTHCTLTYLCLQLNAAARNLAEGTETGSDQPPGVAKPARKSLTGETSKGEPKRHTMHFVGQRDGESQSVGLQRRSLDISSSERLAEDNNRQVGVQVETGQGKLKSEAGFFPLAPTMCIK